MTPETNRGYRRKYKKIYSKKMKSTLLSEIHSKTLGKILLPQLSVDIMDSEC